MSDMTRGSELFGWRLYKLAGEQAQKDFLAELDLDNSLPEVTWKGQIDLLDGAPEEIILQYLPKVYWRAQIVLFHELPAHSLKPAEKLLDDRAKRRLGIEVENKPKKRWSYKSST